MAFSQAIVQQLIADHGGIGQVRMFAMTSGRIFTINGKPGDESGRYSVDFLANEVLKFTSRERTGPDVQPCVDYTVSDQIETITFFTPTP